MWLSSLSLALHTRLTPFCKLPHYLDLLIPSIFVEVVTMINKQAHTVITANINVFVRVCLQAGLGLSVQPHQPKKKPLQSKQHKSTNRTLKLSKAKAKTCQNEQNRGFHKNPKLQQEIVFQIYSWKYVAGLHSQKNWTVNTTPIWNIYLQNHTYKFGDELTLLLYDSFYSAGKTLYYMSEHVGIFSHSHTRASVRSGADVGWWDVAHERCSNSSWWCLAGFRSWLCEAQSGCFTIDSINHFFMCILVSTQDHCHSGTEYLHSILINKYVQ